MKAADQDGLPSERRERLSPAALPQRRYPDVRLPEFRPEQVGIVHLGIGAFHRAHQAVFTEDAATATGDRRWGICGVTQRSTMVVDQLRPQDCLYTVLERGTAHTSARVVGAVRDVLSARDDSAAVLDRIADDAVHVVTLTVTEKGYHRRADGRLDVSDPLVRDDLRGQPPRTPVGQLVRGLEGRMSRGSGPLSVLACDNLVSGGAVLRDLVLDFCAALPEGDRLGGWITENVTFPSSVVDRLVPTTRDADRAEVARLLGADDAAVVVAEPFRQWVIEDHFAAPRPVWERAGAVVTSNVRPYEAAKLRLLNGTHSLLAYAGALAGHGTIAEAVGDTRLSEAALRFMVDDAAPTLEAPPGLDLADYRTHVLDRFANRALPHTTLQVATDGSHKLPQRLLGTIRDRLAVGTEPNWAAFAVAAWMVFVSRGTDVHGRALPLDDPLADRLRAASAGATTAGSVVDSLLGIAEIFGDDLRDHAGLRALLVDHVRALS